MPHEALLAGWPSRLAPAQGQVEELARQPYSVVISVSKGLPDLD